MIENQSVKEIQKGINSREISIKEVVEYYLDKIEKLNPDLNAIVIQKDRKLIIKEAIQKDNANEIDKPFKTFKQTIYFFLLKFTFCIPASYIFN